MIRHKRLIRSRQHKAAGGAPFPLPKGKAELRNCFGKMKRYNDQTGKYDIDA